MKVTHVPKNGNGQEKKKAPRSAIQVIETNQNRLQKQRARKHSINISKEKQQTETKKHGKNLTQLLNIFNSSIAEGPVYVCTCCEQIWFRHSVFNVNEITLKTNDERTTFNTCRTEYVSKDGKEWICKTCRNSIKQGKIPRLSLQNRMGFPKLPPQLKLFSMEERLIAPRIVFMLLRDHPVGRQTFVRGNFVNVPVDIAPTVNILPRSLNETETVTIKFKRKKQYKKCEFKETIRPTAVWTALDYLLKESPLYKEANIQVDTSWLDSMCNLSNNDRELVTGLRHDSDFYVESQDEESDLNHMYNAETCVDDLEQNQGDPNEMSDDEGITFTEVDEDNLETCVADMDTMLDDYEPIIPQPDEPLVPQELTFAPGEGQIPVSVFKDENAEYLAFPTIFCGQKRPDNRD